MKKQIILLAVAFAALLTVSCAKETVNDNFAQAGMKKVTITASAEMTKTTYSETGAFSWTKGDKISVLGDDKNFYVLTAEESGARVEFTGDVPSTVELTGRAFYPADELHACIEGAEWDSYEFNIPEYKDLTAAFSADLPMGSNTDGEGVYSFKHMTGAALLTFTGLEDYASVEITLSNASLKLSGIFKPYTNPDGIWIYGVQGAPEGGSKFIRKVAVVDGIAQVYLPYAADLWAETKVDIVGFDAAGDETELLSGKTMKGNGTAFPRATVIPYAPFEVPPFAPSVDWSKVNWASASVAETADAMAPLKVVADKYYLYFRVGATTDFTGSHIQFYFGSGLGEEKAWYEWTTTPASFYTKEIRFYKEEIDFVNRVVVEGDVKYWDVAFPRSTHESVAASGEAYVGVYSVDESNSWGLVGNSPAKDEEMLVVTLP